MLKYLVGTAVLILDIPVSLLSGVCGFFLPRWWHVPVAAAVIALAVESYVAYGAMEFGEAFADNWGRALPARFASVLVVMFAGNGLGRLWRRRHPPTDAPR